MANETGREKEQDETDRMIGRQRRDNWLQRMRISAESQKDRLTKALLKQQCRRGYKRTSEVRGGTRETNGLDKTTKQ